MEKKTQVGVYILRDIQQDMLIKKAHMRMVVDITQESLYAYSRHTPTPPHLTSSPLTNPHLSPPRCKRQKYQVSALLTLHAAANLQDTTYRQPRHQRPPTPRRAGLYKSSFVSCGSLLLRGSPMADSRPHAAGFVKIPPEANHHERPMSRHQTEEKEKRPLSQQCACMPCRGPDHVNHHERPWHEPNIGGGDPHTSQCACLPWTRSRMSPPYVNHRERPMGTPPT